jgi:hypothetical protein
MAVGARHRLCLRVAFHAEKTSSKPLKRAIYTIFYRLIKGLRWATWWEGWNGDSFVGSEAVERLERLERLIKS